MGSCTGTWENCDGSTGNGCEIDLATDAENCGQCGEGCSLPNANMGCTNSQCTFLSCVGDWRNCDGNVQSGCETLVTNDDLNCGACGSCALAPSCCAPARAAPAATAASRPGPSDAE